MTDAETSPAAAAGRFTFPGTTLGVSRMGYGAMQLAGPHVFGPPKDPDEARAVLRQAVALGVDHIDTSDYYGPHITNQLIREALSPYPAGTGPGHQDRRLARCRWRLDPGAQR